MTKAKVSKVKATKSKAKPKNSEHRSMRSLMIAVVFVLIVILGILIGLLVVNKQPVTAFLPAEQTVGVFEFENDSLPGELEGVSLIAALQSITGLPLSDLPETWWDQPFGVVLMEQEGGENVWVLFAQGASRRAMMNDLQTSGLETGSFKADPAVYTYAQGLSFSFGFSNHHVFISHSQQAIDTLEAVDIEQLSTLEDDVEFLSTQDHVPNSAWMKVYLQTGKVSLPSFAAADYAVSSMGHAADYIAIAIDDTNRGLDVTTWLSLARPKGINEVFEMQVAADEMARYIPGDLTAAFATGPNLTEQWQATLTDLSHINPAYGVILESLVRAQVQELFGGNVNLRNDLYPLFEGAYAAVVAQEQAGYSIGLVVEHDDKGFVQVKLDKLLNGFYALVGQLNPQIKEVTLPDGSVSRELVANAQNAEETQEEYGGVTLTCLSAEVSDIATLKGELLRSFCYAATPELFYVATSKTLLQQMLDATEDKSVALSSVNEFKQGLNQSGDGNEVAYVDMNRFADLLSRATMIEIEVPIEDTEETEVESGEEELGEEDSSETDEEEIEDEPVPEFEILQQESLLALFLAQLGKSTWVKTVESDGVLIEGLVVLD